jgi:hypothetical protein
VLNRDETLTAPSRNARIYAARSITSTTLPIGADESTRPFAGEPASCPRDRCRNAALPRSVGPVPFPGVRKCSNLRPVRIDSIFSSARAIAEGGMVRPRAFAVLQLTSYSNLIGRRPANLALLALENPWRIHVASRQVTVRLPP